MSCVVTVDISLSVIPCSSLGSGKGRIASSLTPIDTCLEAMNSGESHFSVQKCFKNSATVFIACSRAA